MIFRKPANDRDLEVLELRMQLDILRGQHSSLQSQYSDVTHRVQIIKHTEQEVLKYLKDIEGILLTFDGDAYVREIDQRTPKDRVIYIVEAINKMKSNYIMIIENLRIIEYR